MPAAAAAPETDEDVRIAAAAAADVVEVATVRLSVADDDLGGGDEHVELFFVLLLKLPRKESILPDIRLPKLFISPDRSEIPLKKSFFGTEEEVVADEDDDETGDAAPDATPLDEPLEDLRDSSDLLKADGSVL